MKFSFKKGGGEEKKAKASKRKSRSGGDGLASAKAFFASHGEKLLLSAIAVVSLYVIYSGFNKDGLNSDPGDIETAIATATRTINAPTWPDVKQLRYSEPDQFDQQATKDLIAIDLASFAMPMPLHPVLQEQQKRRTDPQLIAPLELEVKAGYGPLAVTDDGRDDGISDLVSSPEQNRPLPEKYHNMKAKSLMTAARTESRFFVAINGLVPVRQQQESFKTALANAVEFVIERDTPKYWAVGIERREVQPDGQTSGWTDVNAYRTMTDAPKSWDGSGDERADSEHIIKPLVMPLPPLVFRDISDWAVHSKIPIAVDETQRGLREVETDDRDEISIDPFDFGGGVRNEEREPSGDPEGDRQLADDFYSEIKVEFALMRYFDFDVQPGKTYQYRARLFLEDPNNPRDFTRPSANACETDVIVRRQVNPAKQFVESPWSDPSTPVVVPTGRSVYVGHVDAPNVRSVNARVSLPSRDSDEPVATVIAVTWNESQAMDVPAEVSVRRGAVINGTGDVEAIDPAKSRVVALPGYTFATDALVLDIAGGEMLERRGQVRAPGILLLMDDKGKIHYHDELGDYEKFDFFTIPQEEDEVFGDAPEDDAGQEPAKEDRRSRRERLQQESESNELRGRGGRGNR